MHTELIFIAVITFAAAMLQGLSGFGSALLAMSFLPFVIEDIRTAVPYVALNAIIISAVNFYREKQHFEIKEVSPAIIGTLPGIMIGILLLKNVDPTIIKKVLGSFLVAYSVYSLAVKLKSRKNMDVKWGYLFGFVAGIMGGAFTINGPFMVLYCSLKYNDKRKIKVLLSSFFIVSGFITIIGYAGSGMITTEVASLFAYNALLTVAGVFAGNYFYDKINTTIFKRLIYLILFFSGVMLLR